MEEKIIEIISEQLGIEKEDITPESNFVDDLDCDSLDLVDLIMKFEDEFGVKIADEDTAKLATVGDAVTFIEEMKK
jgi:acyl carrier protein